MLLPKGWRFIDPWPIWIVGGALAGLTAAISIAALAQGLQPDPDPDRGAALAERWCADCHVVGPDQPGGDAGPAFEVIARTRDDAALRKWMAEPHPPMPAIDIPADAARDISAYILGLTDCREATC